MNKPTTGAPSRSVPLIVAWIMLAVVFGIAIAFWYVPISWYQAREWIFPLVMIPTVGFSIYLAIRRRDLLLGAAAVLAIISPALVLAIATLIGVYAR